LIQIREVHPKVLEITGPHSYEQVLSHVHRYVPKPQHNPFLSLVPEQGVKLTPRPLCLSENFRRLQPSLHLLHHPSMRGDLDSRAVGEVLDEAKRLVDAGVKELLVISQDTSAYGVDVKHRTGFWNGSPVKTSMVSLCEQLAKLGVWVRPALRLSLPARRRSYSVDGGRQNPALSRYSVAACQPAHSEADEASWRGGTHAGAD
jgi:ribosomal protein S12 methylthiotransferase